MDKQLSIASVERETGLSRETLRIWERRYGFPNPGRDSNGDRAFSSPDVERLMLIKRLLEMGYRPGRIVPLPPAELARLGQDGGVTTTRSPDQENPLLAEYITPLLTGRTDELRQALDQALLRLGLSDFVQRIIAPLNVAVGDYWLRGDLPIHAEHNCTEIVQQMLRRALDKLPRKENGPRVLLTTPSGEFHGLGLLMAEILLTLEGAHCLSLGVNLPTTEIAAAARLHGSRIVGLSFSPAYPRRQIGAVLRDLRGQLADSTDLWAGGTTVQHLRLPNGVIRCVRLAELPAMLRDWQRRQGGAAALAPPLVSA